ncbi:hypothetical protein DMB95_07815 [Campylobacter sp. MIT 12-8780]|uniref:hypothetical protein n=1 Tax=unclassified Campylobacter TaxID=2593542 RepID=UPI00115DB744|nr:MULTISPECIES: hypothetical protein [unclassified Campylobacter]NDJ28027.1 hypothetical protein [Campylobacter sp. MIT 19-121]TQR40516.1 hypothetical protein DMB95_07815 [Campylobacter sp. MIT 12-8780]
MNDIKQASQHEIRFCHIDEADLLMNFIENHWKKGHILAHSKELLDFQHLDKENKRYNFVVAFNTQSKEFDAILGFIPLSKYDISLKSLNEYWLAIWMVKKEFAKHGIGLKLYYHFIKCFEPSSIGIIGISEDAKKIYKAFKYKIDFLQHFYIKNETLKDFKIASFSQNLQALSSSSTHKIEQISLASFKNTKLFLAHSPRKSLDFFINRYEKHPFYTYEFFGIFEKDFLQCILVMRENKIQGAKCLRIVDFAGTFPNNLYAQFQTLLQKRQCEYLDLLCYTENASEILKAGFICKNEQDLVPNYFEPFEKKNVNIEFAYKTEAKDYILCKADGDQDRPNILPLSSGGGALIHERLKSSSFYPPYPYHFKNLLCA